MKADAIVDAARACLGTPFRHMGRTPGKALDCAGLAVAVARSLGMDVADLAAYGRAPAGGLLEDSLDRQSALVRVLRPPEAGDLLLMRFRGEPQHIGICCGDTLIHAWQTVGKVAEHRLTDVWLTRTVRVYEFAGMEK